MQPSGGFTRASYVEALQTEREALTARDYPPDREATRGRRLGEIDAELEKYGVTPPGSSTSSGSSSRRPARERAVPNA